LAAQGTTHAVRFKPLSAHQPTVVNPVFTNLSGKWTGFTDVLQRGKCGLRGGNIPARMHIGTDSMLTAQTDGTLVASFAFAPSFVANHAVDASGRIDAMLAVTLEQSFTAVCNGAERSYTIHYSGTVTTKKGRYELELQGEDVPCPDSGCAFKRIVRLKKDKK
jgi:hypothetical protein